MPVWGALLGTLGWNLRRHFKHRSTLCSATRDVLPWWAVVVGWLLLSAWFIRHFIRGYH